MMQFLILDDSLENTFTHSREIEISYDGDWVFFDSSKSNGCAIYKLSSPISENVKTAHLLSNVNKHFLEHLLGLFTPDLNTQIAIHRQASFKEFCIKLNELLNENKKVYDLSRKEFWIWSEPNIKEEILMGDKLRDFLHIT